jgi:hypothetical protein
LNLEFLFCLKVVFVWFKNYIFTAVGNSCKKFQRCLQQHLQGCGVAQSGCGVAQLGCGVAQKGAVWLN